MYNVTMLNKDSLMKLMHMAATVRETRAVYKSSKAQLIKLK